MYQPRRESPEVSSNVSLDVSLESGRDPAAGNGAARSRLRSPGKYLVRSGSVYLFQMRLPQDIGGSPARVVRIGLGAMTASQARTRAELLAAFARECFEQVRARRMDQTDGEANEGAPVFGGETPEITAAEVKGYLKGFHAIISQPAPPTPPHQLPAFAGIRELVLLNRELAKGENANPLIADNAEALKQKAIARIGETLDIIDRSRSAMAPANVAPHASNDSDDGRRPPADKQLDRHPARQSAASMSDSGSMRSTDVQPQLAKGASG